MCRRNFSKKGKDSFSFHCGMHPLWELSESVNLARFHHTAYVNTTGLTTGPLPGIAPQIIRPIKTIRKKN
jgi:hypothetical protein